MKNRTQVKWNKIIAFAFLNYSVIGMAASECDLMVPSKKRATVQIFQGEKLDGKTECEIFVKTASETKLLVGRQYSQPRCEKLGNGNGTYLTYVDAIGWQEYVKGYTTPIHVVNGFGSSDDNYTSGGNWVEYVDRRQVWYKKPITNYFTMAAAIQDIPLSRDEIKGLRCMKIEQCGAESSSVTDIQKYSELEKTLGCLEITRDELDEFRKLKTLD